jgi:hypothetical protein
MGNFLTQAGSDFWDILRKKLPESFGMEWGLPEVPELAKPAGLARAAANAYSSIPTPSTDTISKEIGGRVAMSGLGTPPEEVKKPVFSAPIATANAAEKPINPPASAAWTPSAEAKGVASMIPGSLLTPRSEYLMNNSPEFWQTHGSAIESARGDINKLRPIVESFSNWTDKGVPMGGRTQRQAGGSAPAAVGSEIVPTVSDQIRTTPGISARQFLNNPVDRFTPNVPEPNAAPVPSRELPTPNPAETFRNILEEAKNSFYYSPSMIGKEAQLMGQAMGPALSAAANVVGHQYMNEGDRIRGEFGLAGDRTKGEYGLANHRTAGEYGVEGHRIAGEALVEGHRLAGEYGLQKEAMSEAGALKRTGMTESGAMARARLLADSKELKVVETPEEKSRRMLNEHREKGVMDAEQKALLDPLTPPTQKAELQQRIEKRAALLTGRGTSAVPELNPGERIILNKAGKQIVVDKNNVVVRELN